MVSFCFKDKNSFYVRKTSVILVLASEFMQLEGEQLKQYNWTCGPNSNFMVLVNPDGSLNQISSAICSSSNYKKENELSGSCAMNDYSIDSSPLQPGALRSIILRRFG